MPAPTRSEAMEGYIASHQRHATTGTEEERRRLSSANSMRMSNEAFRARRVAACARGMAIDEVHHFDYPSMPEFLKAVDEPPYYALVTPAQVGEELFAVTEHTFLRIKAFPHPDKGLIEAIVPQRPTDPYGKLLIHEAFVPGTQRVRFRDYSCGPFSRLESTSTGTFDSDGVEEREYSYWIERKYFDETGTNVIGHRVLNDGLVIADCRDIVAYAYEERTDGYEFPLRVWGRKNSDVTCCTHFNDEGARTHCAFSDGRTSLFTGPAGRERQVSVTKDPALHDGVVREFYAGPPGASYMTRQLHEDGTIRFFAGTTPNLVRLVKKWHPSGKTELYEGEHRRERKIGEGFEPRGGDTAAPEPLLALPQPQEGPKPGTQLRVGAAHPRSDLHGKRIALTRSVGGDVWEFAWLDAPEPKRAKGQTAWSIALAHTVTDEAYLAAKAAKEAERAAKAESSKAKKRAQKQAKQLAADAKLAAELQAEEDKAAQPAPPVPPPEGKHHPLKALARCPIDGALLTDAVLASDGYVYNKGSLQSYWCAREALVSPITGVEVTNVLRAHNPLRSLAKELQAAPVAKGETVPTEEPEFALCPITHEVMGTPVLAEDGYAYDKAALEQWFKTGATISPLTGSPMGETVRLDRHMAVLCRAWA